MNIQPLTLALITGQHAFDVPGFYALFRAMPGIDFYPQALEDWAADFGGMRERYDVLVFYNYHQTLDAPGGRTWGRDVRRAVERLGESPQGLVLLHHGIGAFQAWDVWSELVGMPDRRFEYFKDERVYVQVADPLHPITRGLTDWEIVDEVYALPAVAGDAHVLLTTDHPRSTPTLAWTRQHGAARVFCYQSGHDRRVYDDPGFRTVLERGIRWALRSRLSGQNQNRWKAIRNTQYALRNTRHPLKSETRRFPCASEYLRVLFQKLPFEAALDKIAAAGATAVEIGAGGYCGEHHCPVDELLESAEKRKAYLKAVTPAD